MLGGVGLVNTHTYTHKVYCNGLCVTLCTEPWLTPVTIAQHGVLDDFKFKKKSFLMTKTAPLHTHINSRSFFSRTPLWCMIIISRLRWFHGIFISAVLACSQHQAQTAWWFVMLQCSTAFFSPPFGRRSYWSCRDRGWPTSLWNGDGYESSNQTFQRTVRSISA